MRRSTIQLASPTLCFDRAGARLVVVEPDAISVVELARSQTRRIEVRDARAAAAFDDQLWIATHDDQLERRDLAGHVIGEALPLAFATPATLLAAPCGPPAILWGSTPALAVIDDFGQLVRSELMEADAVLPLTGRRHVLARGGRVTLPSGVGAQLAGQVLGGAVLADGKSVVLIVARAEQRELIVLALGTGQVTQRCELPAGAIRLAARRAIAVVQRDPRTLVAIDLRVGRELGAIRCGADVRDLALDPDARRLVLRHGDGGIEVHELAALLRRDDAASPNELAAAERAGAPHAPEPGDPSRPASPPDARPTAPRATAPYLHAAAAPSEAETRAAELAELASSGDSDWRCPPLIALAPRRRPAPVHRAEALAQLDREMAGVALWTLRAIAGAWDSRRLGYGNEGKHPYELEVAAILGLNRGHATEYVQAADERIAEHALALAGDPDWRSPATPIGALIAELALSDRAIDVLLVVAAAALWGEAARLYGILANDTARPNIDELVVQQVLAARHDRHDVAAELDPRAPLVRLGLIRVSTRRPPPFAELAVDPVILDLLRARRPDLGAATTVRHATRAIGALDVPRQVLIDAVLALARTTGPTRIVVRGRTGSGRTTVLAALAAEAGRDLAVIDARALPRAADAFAAELGQALCRAQLAGLVPCLAHLDDVTFDALAARDVAAETLRLHPGPIAVVTSADAPAPFPAGHVAIELPVLAETARRTVWAHACAGLPVADLDALAARYRIGPGQIRRAVAAAREHAGDDATPAIDAYLRQTRDARLSQYARRVERLASWSSVVLPPDILDSLRELVGRVRHRRTVFDTWGMGRKMATSRGLTALFQGSPGTGKTLVAGVIARELGLDLYQVDLSKVMSKWIGETERNLSQIFDAAEDGQVVLLFDEADSLFAKRTEVRSSNDRYANLEVNYLLQRLDAFEGIAILTTNIGSSIDQAFKRRLSFRLSFPFPDEETREHLWRAHLPAELPIDGALTLDVLARKYQLSGGYIRNSCLRAAFLAAQEETALHQRHLERAVALEYAELGKLSSGGAID
jgi:AAA+ superfamily predicted ATPase